jgi:hypothetical protein
MRRLAAALFVTALSSGEGRADPAMDALAAAYPGHVAGYDATDVIFKDGTRLPISDGRSKTFEQMLDDASIRDQFAISYPLRAFAGVPGINEDPGRIRNEAFFRKIYGDCRKGEVARHLKPVAWLPGRNGGTVMVTAANGVAERLAQVSAELDKLPASMTQYLVPSAGTYNCRPVAGTKRLSVHAYGAAIDLNTKFGDYWFWSKGAGGKPVWKNRIPLTIVQIFERHGFIWGGKWYHFDSFHFEYRPEIIALARQGWPRE